MSTPTFKPKKAFIHVPGHGVVSKQDFNKDHAAILLRRAEGHGVNKDKFIKQHLVIDSFGDMELFKEPEGQDNSQAEVQGAKPKTEKPKKGKPKNKKAEAELTEDEQLEKMIAEEEAQKSDTVNAGE
jgi:hypothetical protein